MQQIEIITKEDVAAVVEQILDERLDVLRSDMSSMIGGTIADVVKAEMPRALESVMESELSDLKAEIVGALEQAIRKVLQDAVLATRDYENDDIV